MIVAGFGNPLLDYIVQIPDNSLLKKYNLNTNDAKEISQDELQLLHDEIKTTYTLSSMLPGGCTQNTLRIIEWLAENTVTIYMFGAIGDDENGQFLKSTVEKQNITTRYAIKSLPTGIMFSLVHDENRSIVGNIGASELYSKEDLEQKENIAILKTITLVYMEGFFITNRQLVSKYIVNFCKDNKKVFTFNLCAEYLIMEHIAIINEIIENCDILFGNMDEFKCLTRNNRKPDHTAYAKELTQGTDKIIVITNGSSNIMCVEKGINVHDVKIPKMGKSLIIDTTGAGDSFVGGFLYGYLNNKDVSTCINWGIQTAQHVIQYVGVELPPEVFSFK